MCVHAQFALRWRTEDEVLSEAGEATCGNTRCAHHRPGGAQPPLTTLELPFAYAEHGEHKTALVKVVLCGRCVKKLMWKRRKEKEEGEGAGGGEAGPSGVGGESEGGGVLLEGEGESRRKSRKRGEPREEGEARRRRSSRSRSPRTHDKPSRRRSPERTRSREKAKLT